MFKMEAPPLEIKVIVFNVGYQIRIGIIKSHDNQNLWMGASQIVWQVAFWRFNPHREVLN